MKRREADVLVKLRSALLQCAAETNCERVSAFVVQAIRPSYGEQGERTDVTLFGLCPDHAMHWRRIMRDQGWWEGARVNFDELGELLDEMRAAGWDMRRAIA